MKPQKGAKCKKNKIGIQYNQGFIRRKNSISDFLRDHHQLLEEKNNIESPARRSFPFSIASTFFEEDKLKGLTHPLYD